MKLGDIYSVQEALPLGYRLELSNLLSKFQQACLFVLSVSFSDKTPVASIRSFQGHNDSVNVLSIKNELCNVNLSLLLLLHFGMT